MNDRLRIRIAALATAAFIGTLSIAGVAVRHATPPPATSSATAQPAPHGDDGGEIDEE